MKKKQKQEVEKQNATHTKQRETKPRNTWGIRKI